MEKLINKLFTPKCLFCGTVGKVFCDNCLSKCQVVTRQHCIVCDSYSTSGSTHKKCYSQTRPSRLICTYVYEGLVRECIRKSKYNSMYFSTLKELSYEACRLLEEQNLSRYLAERIVVSIPLSKKKEKIRGFNQVDIIADKLCKEFKLEKKTSILNRVKDTTAQHSYGREQRFSNIEGCFYADKRKVKGKDFLVVDDISTTGATMLEASRILLDRVAACR